MGKLYLDVQFVDKQMRWDRKLINLVKKYPALYDKRHKDYGDQNVKDDIWREIEKKLEPSDKDLKDRFDELIAKYHEVKIDICNNTPISRIWPLFEYMKYFEPYDLGYKKSVTKKDEGVVCFLKKFLKTIHELKIQ
ncbi:uncharacterized protein LOC109607845 [Aethina tumida]|uniref:uncharacterized protein LOC109607845 n=1 Tax=Aethina tumida TaxID=116153 RepID=UPI00096B2E29|nr:uncharacterized protein LOC109607845 [Aethina tumida]